MATILIGADICPIGVNQPLFVAGDAKGLFNDLLPEFQRADLSVVNLECPLITKHSAIRKTGPTFGESPDCLNGLKSAGIKVVNLANNHILDHGDQGLRSTLESCQKVGLETVGAGENLAAARQILVRRAGELRVGILSMAEHEFSIAGENSWGANPLDIIDFVRNVREHRSEFDYLIVLVHGAHEFQPITPGLQKACRFLVEMGANAVVVQHPHSLGGYEAYGGGYIVYGQGALLMDEEVYRRLETFHEAFLVKLTLERSRSEGSTLKSQVSILPFTQSDPKPGARRMKGERERQFLRDLEERSRKVVDPSFVEAEWLRFCEQHKHGYIGGLLGFNRIMHRLNRHGLLFRLTYGKRPLLGVRNLVQCETHREAIQTIFAHKLV